MRYSKVDFRRLNVEFLEDRRLLAADFSGNGVVDNVDLPVWQANYGTSGAVLQSQGDADGDEDVDGRDFLAWQRTFGQTVAPPSPAINISINTLTEALEESPGAIVFRNSDFSKQVLHTNQAYRGTRLTIQLQIWYTIRMQMRILHRQA